MAQLLETLRNNATFTSLFGRRLALDPTGFLSGMPGIRMPIEDLQTTVATSITPFGVTRNLTSGSSQNGQHTLQAMVVGTIKILTLVSTSTGTQQYTMPTGVTLYNTSAGTSSAVVSLTYPGATATLLAETTAVYRCIAQTGSTALAAANSVLFTTTT